MPIYHLWESDSECNPTGKEQMLDAPTLRWAIKHLAFELKGRIVFRGKMLRIDDGKFWIGRKIKD